MQVHVAELRDHEVKDVRLPHLLDLVLEFEDTPHIGREPLDVADEVFFDVVRVALQLLKIQRRVVMKSLARRLVQQPVESIIVELAPFALIKIRQYALVGASTQSKRRSTVIGSMTRSYCGGR